MFSATQIADFLACHHLTALERSAAAGEIKRPFFHDPGIELLRALGLRHEQAYLSGLLAKGLRVVEIPTNIRWTEAAARTVDAVQQGAEAVYQATFLDGSWGGRADFLLKLNEPSDLGGWSYEVIETKLALSTKARAVIQLCFYSDLLARIQGRLPQRMHVVLGGTAEPERLQASHYLAYFRRIRKDYELARRNGGATYPEPVEHCDVCSWTCLCDERWRSDDYLSLVAGITKNQRKVLTSRDVSTVENLARLPLPAQPPIDGIGATALVRIREQARLQVEGREGGRLIYELLKPVESERGLAALPTPSAGDIFLDFESDPYALNQEGLEYLTGVLMMGGGAGRDPVYVALWSFDRASEKQTFERFIAGVMERRVRYPDMHIYHYAAFEPTTIKRLMLIRLLQVAG
jgi:uncharacterized protein